MATAVSHNKKSSAVKRILSEARELNEPTAEFAANPLEDNLFEWHFTLRGPSTSEFQDGIYHGRILLPVEYPFRPPDVMILTPNGRWELNKKICLTFTGFHEEMWQPAWGIRTALIAVQAFMGARAEQAVGIGSLDYPPEERQRLAKLSSDWTCPICKQKNRDLLKQQDNEQERHQEALPEGLTIDLNRKSNKSEQEDQPTKSTSSEATTFSGSEGPSDVMLARLLENTEKSNYLQSSISSSQVTTPGRQSSPGAIIDTESASDKGKERQVDSTAESNLPVTPPNIISSSANAPTSAPMQRTISSAATNSSSQGIRHESSTIRRRLSSAFVRNVDQIARPGSAEASAQRLAALDRAIMTVLFMLAALILRRLSNTWRGEISK